MYVPTHLDLFSGIGGFALAAQWAGFKTIGFSEIDPYANAVLRKHWPDVPNYGDVRTMPTIRCDLVTGGFPCQPFSCAGKQRGKADDRDLWPAMFDVIRKCQPTWVLGENVVGFIDMELEQSITNLEGEGYEVQPIVIPTCALGAAHIRQRVWICAYAPSLRRHANEHVYPSTIAQGCGKKQKARTYRQGFVKLDASNRLAIQQLYSEQTMDDYFAECCGKSNGLSTELDRLKGLGNAVVPQVAFQILKTIYHLTYA